MFITGVGSFVPGKGFQQRECWEALSRASAFQQLTRRARSLCEKVLLGDNGIQKRHFVFENLAEAFDLRPDAMQDRFSRHAPRLAAEASRRALSSAGISPSEVDAVIVSTCTGYLCPGLTSYVSELLKLNRQVLPLDLVGQGCGAALPNLATGAALVHSGQARHVLSVCVEVCSAAFYLDNDAGVLISACLFGDGAAAAVCSADASRSHLSRRVEWRGWHSTLVPEERESLRFQHRAGMLRNVLDKSVPLLAGEHALLVFEEASREFGFQNEEIRAWITHAGGRDVLAAISGRFELPPGALRFSEGVLRDFGNMSSPSVLFALERALEGDAPNGKWWMASFGAGITSFGALLETGNCDGSQKG